jgi:hypothetical protein
VKREIGDYLPSFWPGILFGDSKDNLRHCQRLSRSWTGSKSENLEDTGSQSNTEKLSQARKASLLIQRFKIGFQRDLKFSFSVAQHQPSYRASIT